MTIQIKQIVFLSLLLFMVSYAQTNVVTEAKKTDGGEFLKDLLIFYRATDPNTNKAPGETEGKFKIKDLNEFVVYADGLQAKWKANKSCYLFFSSYICEGLRQDFFNDSRSKELSRKYAIKALKEVEDIGDSNSLQYAFVLLMCAKYEPLDVNVSNKIKVRDETAKYYFNTWEKLDKVIDKRFDVNKCDCFLPLPKTLTLEERMGPSAKDPRSQEYFSKIKYCNSQVDNRKLRKKYLSKMRDYLAALYSASDGTTLDKDSLKQDIGKAVDDPNIREIIFNAVLKSKDDTLFETGNIILRTDITKDVERLKASTKKIQRPKSKEAFQKLKTMLDMASAEWVKAQGYVNEGKVDVNFNSMPSGYSGEYETEEKLYSYWFNSAAENIARIDISQKNTEVKYGLIRTWELAMSPYGRYPDRLTFISRKRDSWIDFYPDGRIKNFNFTQGNGNRCHLYWDEDGKITSEKYGEKRPEIKKKTPSWTPEQKEQY